MWEAAFALALWHSGDSALDPAVAGVARLCCLDLAQ
jgi:hypothetical protein